MWARAGMRENALLCPYAGFAVRLRRHIPPLTPTQKRCEYKLVCLAIRRLACVPSPVRLLLSMTGVFSALHVHQIGVEPQCEWTGEGCDGSPRTAIKMQR